MRGDDLFFVSLTDRNPYFARDYINALIGIYVEENLTKKREESYGATRFLDEQIGSYKQKLDEIDAKIIEFRKKTGIFSNVSEASVMAQIAKDQNDLRALRVKKNETTGDHQDDRATVEDAQGNHRPWFQQCDGR